MSADRPSEQHPHPDRGDGASGGVAAPEAPLPAAERMKRFSTANMLRSLLPLVLIVLVLVGWQAFRQSKDVQPVRPIDPASTVQLAAARAGYAVLVPTGLPEGYRPTSARTDAGGTGQGGSVTLQIGYVTPSEEFAGFVISDDPRAEPLTAVLNGAQENGTVDAGGRSWTRLTTERGETALSRQEDGVTVVVSGSAPERELATVAGSLQPYSG